MNRVTLYVLCIGLAIPALAFAHGGVEKVVGNTMVFLNQTPLSPLVSEQVHLPFVLTDEKTNQPLVHIPVKVTVTDTFLGDETRDRIIYSTTMSTDVNGVLDFTYTFPKENYFDIDLHFADASGAEQETGFLVQIRDPSKSLLLKQNIFFFILGLGISFLLYSSIYNYAHKRTR